MTHKQTVLDALTYIAQGGHHGIGITDQASDD